MGMSGKQWGRLGLYAGTLGTYALFDKDQGKSWKAKKGGDPLDTKPDPVPSVTDDAVQAARLFERRQQLGLMGRMSTFLTTGQRQQAPATPQSVNPPTTFLGQ